MNNILLVRSDEQLFDTAAVERIFKSQPGFRDLRFNLPVGDILEAEFGGPHESTIVRLSSDQETISLTGVSDIAILAAFTLQQNLDTPLRMFDTDYSFDVVLSDFQTVEELQVAIDAAQVE